jgi:hypothetical protein
MAEDLAQMQVAENAEGADVFWEPPLPASASDCVAQLPDGSEREPGPFGGENDRFGFRGLPAGTRIVRDGNVLYTFAERR